MNIRAVFVLMMLLGLTVSLAGQSSSPSGAFVSVPPVLQFSDIAADETGAPLGGIVTITFSLYNNSQGGSALWTETQNVQLDSTGHYSVYLGITQTNGIPASLFTAGEAHWLGVKIGGQSEQQPRTYLVSVPYAMKAGDAATVGGLPPSAFVLAAPGGSTNPAAVASTSAVTSPSSTTSSDVTTSGGTVNLIPLWDAATDITNSAMSQSGTGSAAKIGINTTTPATTLDVKGSATIRGTLSTMGTLSLPATGTATSSAGKNSEPMSFTASSFNGSTAVNQAFQWQAEPVNNDMSTASGTLNLLFGSGTNKPTETGLNIASNGQITFATGQTFPGTGSGTITGITTAAGSGLTGGGSSGTLNLGLTNACATSQVLQWNGSAWTCALTGTGTITGVTAGTDLTGGGSSGNVTLNLNTSALNSAYAQLSAANTFTGNQTVSGNLSATGVVTGSSFQIGSNLFAYGSSASNNAFLGFAGNTTMTGFNDTAVGFAALSANTSGYGNTATGGNALSANTLGVFNTGSGTLALSNVTTGSSNTAMGASAGETSDISNMTGSNNTFLGSRAVVSTGALNNATAIGAYAEVTESNAVVLGSIKGTNFATANTSVGIGTTAPAATLDVEAPSGSTPTITFGNPSNQAVFTVNGTGTFTGNVSFPATQTFPGVAELGVANTFTGNQTVNADILLPTTNSSGTQGVIEIGGSAFAFGNTSAGNAFLGFAGNTNNTSQWNTASGWGALSSNTSGFGGNTAIGYGALSSNTTGGNNTAIGRQAGGTVGLSKMTGERNTFLGFGTTASTGSLANATAIGANAQVGESNAVVLGSINGIDEANANVNVGIGTTTPGFTLDVEAPSGSIPTVNFGSASNQAAFTVNGTSTFNGNVTFASAPTFSGLNVESSNNPTLNIGGSSIAGTLSLYGNLLIGGTIFDYGSAVAGNAFVGFAGNSGLMPAGTANTAVGFQALTTNASATSTGSDNTAVGNETLLANSAGSLNTGIGANALLENTTGSFNAATGAYALFSNSTGSDNTANGYSALSSNTGSNNTASGYSALETAIGNNNTGVGYYAGVTLDGSLATGSNNSFFGSGAAFNNGSDGISNATAIGANAVVAQSNTVVLGSINPGVNVGIGTIAPISVLEADVNAPRALGPTLTLTNTGGNPGAAASVDLTSYAPASSGTYNPGSRIEALDNDFSDDLVFLANKPGTANQGLVENMRITAFGNVGIGTSAPDDLLSVNGSADKPGGGSWGTFSDRRLKNLDGSFHSGLSQIMKINPVLYRYKEENAMGITDRQEHVGVVAQDVQRVIPEAVSENSKGYLLVNNDPIIWAMLNAIKEQQNLIQGQQKVIQRQVERIEQLSAQVKMIQTRLKSKGRTGLQIHTAKAEAAVGQR